MNISTKEFFLNKISEENYNVLKRVKKGVF